MSDDDDYGVDDVIQSYGYEPRCTSVDTLMAAPLAMHLAVYEQLTDMED